MKRCSTSLFIREIQVTMTMRYHLKPVRVITSKTRGSKCRWECGEQGTLVHCLGWECKLVQFSSVQSLSRVRFFATPWIAAHQTSLSITNSQSLLKLMSIESVMLTSHLILCHPLLLLPPIPPSITVFSNESTLHMRWPKYWSFSFSISPSNEHPGLSFRISFRMDWLDLLAVQGTLKSLLQTTVQKNQFFSTQFSPQSNSHYLFLEKNTRTQQKRSTSF